MSLSLIMTVGLLRNIMLFFEECLCHLNTIVKCLHVPGKATSLKGVALPDYIVLAHYIDYPSAYLKM